MILFFAASGWWIYRMQRKQLRELLFTEVGRDPDEKFTYRTFWKTSTSRLWRGLFQSPLLTVHNESDETIILLRGTQDSDPADSLADASVLWAISPGSMFGISWVEMDRSGWCENPVNVYWIARSRREIDEIRGTRGPFDPNNFEILETIGPNICWGERFPEFRYVGN